LAYYPFFRGKQNELIVVRECAVLLAESDFVPVIEPVKESTSGLLRAVEAISTAEGSGVLVTNPQQGVHKNNCEPIERLFANELSDHQNMGVGIILTSELSVEEIVAKCERHRDRDITFIHAGFSEARELIQTLGENAVNEIRHIFWEGLFGKLYQIRFIEAANKILLRDGFQVRPNRMHPPVEFFSDLHITYPLENMNGFGDFLIVGKGYSETGGPAYAVAIHITYIDPNKEDQMYVHHFLSDRQDTPTDPAGKFAEALRKLSAEVQNPETNIFRSDAIEEFLDLHQRGHYPGLGYVKKLSMKHHLETLSNYSLNT